MKTVYTVYGTVSGTKLLGEFEAESESEAIQMAEESEDIYVSLCNQCADECDDAQVTDVYVEKVVRTKDKDEEW